MKVVVLAGGTGGAILASGFQSMLPEGDLTVIANTADDDEFWGLLVSPDVDAVIYRLAGAFNDEAGYGVRGDTFHTLEALARLGEDAWFRIGDKDFASHLVRTEFLHRGGRLTDAALELCRRFGIETAVLPMTDARVRTRFDTERGVLSFQEYFVRERLLPVLRRIDFEGIDSAKSTPEGEAALAEADVVVIGPSNPLISIAPILRVLGSRVPPDRTVAISPIVGGVALKGPTVAMMRAMGLEASPVAVAKMYAGAATAFVIDRQDAAMVPAVEALGYRAIVSDTVMTDGGRGLAAAILAASPAQPR
ncbi:MAG TPA: 2-phospho-L-lactate transferase [Candidatus Acidoferrum sp.]|jgi:LPPG:FO 2-phospho-L-lactate transferase|nr:2-phospho-L-lactate transferase [Candidatus Acidoferrum sp.]